MSDLTIKDGETLTEVANRANKLKLAAVFLPRGNDDVKDQIKIGDNYFDIPEELQDVLSAIDMDRLKLATVKKKRRSDNNFFLNVTIDQIDSLL